MALFAIVALKDAGPAVDEAVSSKIPATKSYKIEPGKWAVNADVVTARELSTLLGLLEKHTHLVVSIRGYFGRAQPDLWEWFAAQSEKANV